MTQKYTSIPRRQKCINKEGSYIGGAEDIIDDTLDKTQAEVNAKLYARLEALEGDNT